MLSKFFVGFILLEFLGNVGSSCPEIDWVGGGGGVLVIIVGCGMLALTFAGYPTPVSVCCTDAVYFINLKIVQIRFPDSPYLWF